MNEKPVLTLHQPWATFLIEPGECRCGHDDPQVINDYEGDPPPCRCRPVKWIETRSWKAPQGLVGKRLDIHAGVRQPGPRSMWPEDKLVVGEWRIDYCTDDRHFGWRAVHEQSPDGLYGKMIPLPLGVIIGLGVLIGYMQDTHNARLMGVAPTGNGRREYYGVRRTRSIAAVSGRFAGTALAGPADLHPPVRFGFSSAPTDPQLVTVTTTIDLP